MFDTFKYIKIYQNILHDETLNNFIEVCKTEKKFKDAKIVRPKGEVIEPQVRQTQVWPLHNGMHEKSFTTIHWSNYLLNTFSKYVQKYLSEISQDLTVQLNDIQVLKYNVGGHYKLHVDNGTTTPRTISLIFIVNDGYEGGDLVFSNPERTKEITAETKKNNLIIWPSNFLYPHKVTPVTSGVRYSVVAWAL